MIISGRAKPSFIIVSPRLPLICLQYSSLKCEVQSHECGIEGAPEAYVKFDQRIEGYTK
jgi:hypothetical protein